ncbi:phage holin family protein [Hominenteromicrobium sp.]|mgnify:FL=1|uniref:phage holin family protein n=1 Tax=Hominenteromicrobium sp. TaxID=3073581 RepID=UPI003AAA22CB
MNKATVLKSVTAVVGAGVAIWLIINELISILENLAAIGVPGFPRLEKILERLKNTVSKGDNADEK